MITKEEYVRSIDILKQYEDFEHKIYKLGIDLINVEPLSELCSQYTKILAAAAGDAGKWTDWWIWETQYGADKEVCRYWLKKDNFEGIGHIVESAEQLYDIIQEEKNEVE